VVSRALNFFSVVWFSSVQKKLVPKKYKLKGKETPSLLFVRKKLVPKRKEMKREK